MPAQPLPDFGLPWPVPLDAVALIAESEGLRLSAYLCPAGVPSIGWGETDGVHLGDTCTKEQADRWLCEDLTDRCKAVLALCTRTPTKHELGALLSFAYNVGTAALARSTVLRCHNAGDRAGAARAFGLWNNATNPATGKFYDPPLPGLVRRRAAEAALYLTPDEGEPPPPMPQAVEGDSSLAKSPINKGGAITIGSGVLATASAAADELKDASGVLGKFHEVSAQVADWVGVPPVILFGIVLVAAGVMVVRYRKAQREGGWA
ncbi:MAG: lysozyme [Rubrivivax sp.]|nr:lysozyme [Rubrivivax sp.]